MAVSHKSFSRWNSYGIWKILFVRNSTRKKGGQDERETKRFKSRFLIRFRSGHIQSWALSVFFYFFTNKKLFFAHFIKLI